jgi:hypothetical protein
MLFTPSARDAVRKAKGNWLSVQQKEQGVKDGWSALDGTGLHFPLVKRQQRLSMVIIPIFIVRGRQSGYAR